MTRSTSKYLKWHLTIILLSSLLAYVSCSQTEETTSFPPDVFIIKPEMSSIYEEGESVEIQFTISDKDNDFDHALIYWDEEQIEITYSIGRSEFTYSSLNKIGPHRIKIEAFDTKNNITIETVDFEIDNPNINLSINDISNITDINAVINYNIDINKNLTITEVGLCWSEKPEPTIENEKYSRPISKGNITDTIGLYRDIYSPELNTWTHGQLKPGKNYRIRPYINIKDLGLTYGDILTFNTPKLGWDTIFFDQSFDAISFINVNEWYAFSGSKLFRTTNRGISWTAIYEGFDYRTDGYVFYFKNNKIGFISQNSNSILKTNDGGAHWKQVEFNRTDEFIDFWYNRLYVEGDQTQKTRFVDENFGYLSSRNKDGSAIYITIDNGDSWNVFSSNFSYTDAYFVTPEVGIILSEGAHSAREKAYFTKDGGKNLNPITSLNNLGHIYIENFKMFNEKDGVVVISDDSDKISNYVIKTSNEWNDVDIFEFNSKAFQESYIISSNKIILDIGFSLYSYNFQDNTFKYLCSNIMDKIIPLGGEYLISYNGSSSIDRVFVSENMGNLIYNW